MNPRRIVILSLTLLLAGAAGYGLLGLRAPKQAPAPATPASGGGNATIIAVGPDGTLYAIRAPSGASSTRAYRGDDFRSEGYGGYEREGTGR